MSETTGPSERTRAAERADARAPHRADREPTAQESAAAEAAADQLDEEERRSVAQHEQDMARRGVEQRGEGRISPEGPSSPT